MKKLFPLISLILLLTVCAHSQSSSSIIKAANKALGGEKVLKGIRNVTMSGTITRTSDGATGKYESSIASPSLFSERYELAGFEVASGYNGKSGWIRDSRDGLRTVTGDAARYFQAEAIYRDGRWLDARTDKLKLVAGPKATIDGVNLRSVIVTNPKGVRTMLFFDAVSGRLTREELMTVDGVKAVDYYDYRLVTSIATPFTIRISKGGETYKVSLDTVTYNEPKNVASFDFPQASEEPLPDIPSLLKEVRANASKVGEILENYSYTQLTIDREMDNRGNLVEKGSEKRVLTFYKGRRVNRLVEKNGKALSQAELEREERDAVDQIRDIDKDQAEREARIRNSKEDDRRIGLAEALKGSLLVNPRRERFKNRDVIVFDYEPNPTFKPQTRNERLFALCTGAVWVDTATKQVVRLEAYLTKGFGNFLAKAKQGASFTLDNELVGDEVWLPSRADVNLQIKILFAGINVNNLIKYGDYKRFATEIKDVTVNDPTKP